MFPQFCVFSCHSQNLLKIQRRKQEISEALFCDEEMERTATNREAEIRGLQSDMANLQGEMVDLLNKWHKFGVALERELFFR
jgi:hypothetical protein